MMWKGASARPFHSNDYSLEFGTIEKDVFGSSKTLVVVRKAMSENPVSESSASP